MKLKVTVIFGQYERKFSIPCGTGNKTIKWLGMVASQRYSNAAPNGALRRRDDYCGITENAQYQVEHVYLPGGKIAHPGVMIYDSDLKDGDEVTVKLCSRLAVHNSTGSPTKTKWALLAFSTSTIENPYLNSTRSELIGNDDESAETDVLVGEENKAALALIRSKANFMRVILRSQIVDEKGLAAKLEEIWPRIAAGVPKLRPEDVPQLKKVIESNWDMLSDIFEFYVDGPYIDRNKFSAMIDEAEIFPAYNTAQQCAKIFSRTCAYAKVEENRFDFTCVLIALLLASQVKYNDTLEAGADSLPSYDALDEVFRFHFAPVAERHSLQSVLKYAFCSDECLSYLRPMNDELQIIFNRYATRTQDVPMSITVEELTEILCHAGLLTDPNDLSRTKTILTQIQKSTIHGHDHTIHPKTANDVSFPEYVEAVARAGFIKYFDPEGDAIEGDASDAGGSYDGSVMSSSIVGCLVMGAKAVVDRNNSTTAERHPTAPKGKNNRRK